MPKPPSKHRRRKFQKHLEAILGIRIYASATLLQRVEEGMATAGLKDRSALVGGLLDSWCTERGC